MFFLLRGRYKPNVKLCAVVIVFLPRQPVHRDPIRGIVLQSPYPVDLVQQAGAFIAVVEVVHFL